MRTHLPDSQCRYQFPEGETQLSSTDARGHIPCANAAHPASPLALPAPAEMVTQLTRVNDVVARITVASPDQSLGISQVGRAVAVQVFSV